MTAEARKRRACCSSPRPPRRRREFPVELDRSLDTPLPVQLAAALREAIDAGTLQPGRTGSGYARPREQDRRRPWSCCRAVRTAHRRGVPCRRPRPWHCGAPRTRRVPARRVPRRAGAGGGRCDAAARAPRRLRSPGAAGEGRRGERAKPAPPAASSSRTGSVQGATRPGRTDSERDQQPGMASSLAGSRGARAPRCAAARRPAAARGDRRPPAQDARDRARRDRRCGYRRHARGARSPPHLARHHSRARPRRRCRGPRAAVAARRRCAARSADRRAPNRQRGPRHRRGSPRASSTSSSSPRVTSTRSVDPSRLSAAGSCSHGQSGAASMIVEDDFDSELRFTGSPLPTLAALDDAVDGVRRAARHVLTNGRTRTVGRLLARAREHPITMLTPVRRELGGPRLLGGAVCARALPRDGRAAQTHSPAAAGAMRERRDLVSERLAGATGVRVRPMDGGLHAVLEFVGPDPAQLRERENAAVERVREAGLGAEPLGGYWQRRGSGMAGIVIGSVAPSTPSSTGR